MRSIMEVAGVLLGTLFGILALLCGIALSTGHRDVGLWIGCAATIAAVISGCCFYQAHLWKLDAQVLTHGNGPTPPIKFPTVPIEFNYKPEVIPDSAMILFLGNAVAWTSTFPCGAIKQAGEDLITINKSKDGILISAKFFDKNGKVLCEIVDNTFHLNPNNVFRKETPPHGLKVFNDEARCVLEVDFINEHAVQFFGDFYWRNGLHVVMTLDQCRLGADDFSGNIIGDNGGGGILIR